MFQIPLTLLYYKENFKHEDNDPFKANNNFMNLSFTVPNPIAFLSCYPIFRWFFALQSDVEKDELL